MSNVIINRNAFQTLLNTEGELFLNKVANRVVELAQRFAPIRTGALKNSIKVQPDLETGVAKVIADVPYAAYVELGTLDQAPQPFLRPALEAVANEINNNRLEPLKKI